MKIIIIDGQGGGIGRQLVEKLKEVLPEGHQLLCVGTNAIATQAMLRAGANQGSTGENSIAVMAAEADIIAGPLGIILADSMMGEVTEKMALAISRSGARKVLIPTSRCHVDVAGVTLGQLPAAIDDAVRRVAGLCGQV